jgi:hypothetical protein
MRITPRLAVLTTVVTAGLGWAPSQPPLRQRRMPVPLRSRRAPVLAPRQRALWALKAPPACGWRAADIAVSPDGSMVFVTGDSFSAGFTGHAFGLPQYTTLAYSSGTGAQAWVARFGNVANGSSYANSIAVAPDGV